MRIVFIENEDLNRDSSGGIMSYLLNLAHYIRDENGESVLIGSGIVDLKKESNTFSHVYSISNDSTISNLKFFKKLFISSKLKHIDKGDVIHVQRPEMVIPLFLRKRNRIICTLHGAQDLAVLKKKGKVRGFLYSILQVISFFLVDQLIVVDKNNHDRYIKKYPWIKRKIKLISISVDNNRFYPQGQTKSRKKFNLILNEKIILFIGRLEEEKNVEFIINSFNEIKHKNYKLVIVGKGSLENKLKIMAKKNEAKILFMGEINNSLIPELINAADVLILTSYFEGSPTVVKEALCSNVPVISTDVGDVKEVLEMVNGGVIIDLTVESLRLALEKIFYKEQQINKEASNLFGLKIMGQKTLLIYNQK